MQTTDALDRNPTITWWISARPIFSSFSHFVENLPLTAKDASEQIKQIHDLYQAISEIDCPEEVDDVYDHITQAFLNLFMAYKTAASGNWMQAELFFGYAISEWIYTKSACSNVGIGRIQ